MLDSKMTRDQIEEKLTELRALFDPRTISWKPKSIYPKNYSDVYKQENHPKGEHMRVRVLAMPYLDERVLIERLDEIVGASNWQSKFDTLPSGHVICSIGIKVEEEWIWKCDGGGSSLEDDGAVPARGGMSSSDSAKGDLTSAFKRCAQIQWGIGRYLYMIDAKWVDGGWDGYKLHFDGPPIPLEYIPDKLKKAPSGDPPTPVTPAPQETPSSVPQETPSSAPPVQEPDENESASSANPSKEKKRKPRQQKKATDEQKVDAALLNRAKEKFTVPDGILFSGEKLSKVLTHPNLGEAVIGYLAQAIPNRKGEWYEPEENEDARKLIAAARYIWRFELGKELPIKTDQG